MAIKSDILIRLFRGGQIGTICPLVLAMDRFYRIHAIGEIVN